MSTVRTDRPASIGARPHPAVAARPDFGLRAGPDDRCVLEWHDRAVNQTVLIVDDHAGFRSWTRSLLEMEGFQVVGETADGTSAVTAARDLRPDLVLLDVMLPDISGLEVARRLALLAHPPRVVLVSTREASDYGDAIGHSAAVGFISKHDLSGGRLRELLGVAP